MIYNHTQFQSHHSRWGHILAIWIFLCSPGNWYTITHSSIEVGVHTGHLNIENKKRLHTLHSFCSKDIKLKRFKENVSAFAILGLYYIFNCRNQENWSKPDHILAPFKNQWNMWYKWKFIQKRNHHEQTCRKICTSLLTNINLSLRNLNIFIVMFA